MTDHVMSETLKRWRAQRLQEPTEVARVAAPAPPPPEPEVEA